MSETKSVGQYGDKPRRRFLYIEGIYEKKFIGKESENVK